MQETRPPKISLAAARVNAGMMQKDAAQKIGIALNTLKRYEAGKSIPRVDMLEKISLVYGYPMEYIRV